MGVGRLTIWRRVERWFLDLADTMDTWCSDLGPVFGLPIIAAFVLVGMLVFAPLMAMHGAIHWTTCYPLACPRCGA